MMEDMHTREECISKIHEMIEAMSDDELKALEEKMASESSSKTKKKDIEDMSSDDMVVEINAPQE